MLEAPKVLERILLLSFPFLKSQKMTCQESIRRLGIFFLFPRMIKEELEQEKSHLTPLTSGLLTYSIIKRKAIWILQSLFP